MTAEIVVSRLAAHRHLIPRLADWFRAEWPAWYGSRGKADPVADLTGFAAEGGLPIGVVAFRDGQPCGTAALKSSSIPGYEHLAPWAAAGYVVPELRRQGIGLRLLAALEAEARLLGYPHIYCATARAGTLLERAGWRLLEPATVGDEQVGVYRKRL